MAEASKVLEQFGNRMSVILKGMHDPKPSMKEICANAESAGLLDASGAVRLTNVDQFVEDLLLENPLAFEWAQGAKEWLDPLKINNLPDLLDALQP